MAGGSKQRAKYKGFFVLLCFWDHWRKNTVSKLVVILNLRMDIAAVWCAGPVLPLADKNAPPLQPTKDDMSALALTGLWKSWLRPNHSIRLLPSSPTQTADSESYIFSHDLDSRRGGHRGSSAAATSALHSLLFVRHVSGSSTHTHKKKQTKKKKTRMGFKHRAN